MKILNFGSLNIDYTYDVGHFVSAGETLLSANRQVFSGGKGLNQSIALSRAGAETYHAGAVGVEDGSFLLDMLSAAGVNVENVSRVREATGHAIIQRDREGQNCILLYGGANQTVTPQQAEKVLERFEAGDWLVVQNEISCVKEIMEMAHGKGMKIALNPSPMDEKILALPLEYVDMLLLNEVEAAAICPDCGGSGAELLDTLGKKLRGCGIVLTLGGAGALCVVRGETAAQEAFAVDTVDTTGAGDTFTGFFLAAYTEGRPVQEAMRRAAAAAAIAVSRAGAAPSIPTREEVEEFLEQRT